jgi:soluble lytic murein transglycosylase-like protein
MAIKNEIERISGIYGINPKLVTALCVTESAMDPWATRFEPGWKWYLTPKAFSLTAHTTEKTEAVHQATSWGLMQIMGAVAREEGYNGPLPKLCIPEVGLEFGCRKLRKLIQKNIKLEDALASYNAGKPGTAIGIAYAKKIIEVMG